MALGIPETLRFPHVSCWQDLGTDVTKLMSPALQKKSPLSCAKTIAPLSLCEMTPHWDDISKIHGLRTERQ